MKFTKRTKKVNEVEKIFTAQQEMVDEETRETKELIEAIDSWGLEILENGRPDEIENVTKLLEIRVKLTENMRKNEMAIVEAKIKDKESKRKVSPDTIIVVAANLVGIGLILGHEKLNVISTKALSFVLRGRV